MHFTSEKAEELKAWMVKKLEAISELEADPDILSQFAFAILESDDPDTSIRKNAIEQLEEFLRGHTIPFVNELFARYAPPPAPKPAPKLTSSNPNLHSNGTRPIKAYEPIDIARENGIDRPRADRKRSYQHADEHGPEGDYSNGAGAKGSRMKRQKGARNRQNGPTQRSPTLNGSSAYPFLNMPFLPNPPQGFPGFDPTNPVAAYAFMEAMVGMLPASKNTGSGNRCTNYHNKGFCTLGNLCPFEHGADPMPVDDGEYDPTKANFDLNGFFNEGFIPKSPTRRRRTVDTNQLQSESRRRTKASFSDTRPPLDQSISTIVVEQIPQESFDEQKVRKYFSQFGKVQKVTLKPYKRLALVEFHLRSAASAAWESPKAVFDNRFVKVYWYRPDLEDQKPGNGHSAGDSSKFDKVAFEKAQEGKQKAHEQRLKAKAAMEEAKQDIANRRQAMAEEREVLEKRLAIAEGRDWTTVTDPGDDFSNPKVKALREQLVKMKAEAKSLGIDPDAPAKGPDRPPHRRPKHSSDRGGAMYSGRGRGMLRGQRGGNKFVRGRDPAVKKLDNRPKKVAVSGVEFDQSKEENLRSFLTSLVPFEDIHMSQGRPDSRVICFAERWQAEILMYGPRHIVGVGQVEFAWVGRGSETTPVAPPADLEDGELPDAQQDSVIEVNGHVADQEHDNLDVAGDDDDG